MNTAAHQIFSHTPTWVWALLAGLVALGLKQSRDHVMRRTPLVVVPVVLGVLSLAAVGKAFGADPGVLLLWLLGMAAGIAALTVLKLPLRAQALPNERFAIGGSWMPMAMLLGVFTLRYVVNASLALNPALAHLATFALSASLLYGLMAGLFAGRALRVLAQAPKAAVPLAA
ncbi:DUF6622 family protein [Aquabacterium sp.]|uniref:DUF6622 family protein n=1 Tax=Aquabacterium sp. TaxID=1872578 RepID=UPI002BE53BFA|nr:DUF6622 family protein [Aquabacterium sp.]HSW06390.1 DUF6622 family protein [Aquabacterium sp.]